MEASLRRWQSYSSVSAFTRVIIAKGGQGPTRDRHTSEVSSLHCTFVVAGELGRQFEEVFGGLALSREMGTTRISGSVVDQAELQGVLRQLFDLGQEILVISAHPGEMPVG